MKKPDIDFNSKQFHLNLLMSIEQEVSRNTRKTSWNVALVRDFVLGNTSKGGSTSCMDYCRWLEIDPYGFTFYND
jgi:hypothetical protein